MMEPEMESMKAWRLVQETGSKLVLQRALKTELNLALKKVQRKARYSAPKTELEMESYLAQGTESKMASHLAQEKESTTAQSLVPRMESNLALTKECCLVPKMVVN